MKTFCIVLLVILCGGWGPCNARDNAPMRFAGSLEVGNIGDGLWEGNGVPCMIAQVEDIDGGILAYPNMGLDYSNDNYFYNDGWWYPDVNGDITSWCISRSNGAGQFMCSPNRAFDRHWGWAMAEATLWIPNSRTRSVDIWASSWTEGDCTKGCSRPLDWGEKIWNPDAHSDNGEHMASGGHWIAGGAFHSYTGDGTKQITPISDEPGDPDHLANKLPSQANALAMGGDPSQASGFKIVQEGLQIQAGEKGKGYAKAMADFMPSNSADALSMTMYGRPYQYAWTVSFKEPVDLSDRVYTGKLTSMAQPEGTYVDVKHKEASGDDMVHLFVCDFIPMDGELSDVPESYVLYDQWTFDGTDPNSKVFDIQDPNFFMDKEDHFCKVGVDPNYTECVFERMYDPNRLTPVKTIRVGIPDANDVLKLSVEMDAQLMMDIFPFWLSSSKIHDLNGDNKVDMEDFSLLSGL